MSWFKKKTNQDEYNPTIEIKNIGEYIPKRLDEQIKWYDAKANSSKKELSQAQRATIIFSLLISSFSIISLITTSKVANLLTVITGILGTAIVSIETWTRMQKTDEIQRTYRQTCEKLKQEKILYQTKIEPYKYDSDEDLKLLIRRCESIMAHEQGIWAQLKEN